MDRERLTKKIMKEQERKRGTKKKRQEGEEV